MEKLRKLMKEHQDKADKKVMGEVLELLQREPGLFVVTVHATKNFFLGAENGKAAAFLYTSREYADEFVKGLEMVGVETKVLEIRPLQRISFFNDLYRSGFEAVVIDKGQENHMSMSLFSIIEKPKDTSEIVMNPSLVRSANQFYQALVQHQAFPQMQDLMCKELYGARLLVPVADPQKTTAVPVLTTGKGVGGFRKVFFRKPKTFEYTCDLTFVGIAVFVFKFGHQTVVCIQSGIQFVSGERF